MSKAIIPLAEDHLREVVHQQTFEMVGQLDVDTLIRGHIEGGPGFAFVQDGKTYAAIGGAILWKGVAEVWALIAPGISPYWLHRTTLSTINQAFEEYGIHRLQADVAKDWIRGCRWAQALGFQAEGVLHFYGPDRRDYVRYAKWQ